MLVLRERGAGFDFGFWSVFGGGGLVSVGANVLGVIVVRAGDEGEDEFFRPKDEVNLRRRTCPMVPLRFGGAGGGDLGSFVLPREFRTTGDDGNEGEALTASIRILVLGFGMKYSKVSDFIRLPGRLEQSACTTFFGRSDSLCTRRGSNTTRPMCTEPSFYAPFAAYAGLSTGLLLR